MKRGETGKRDQPEPKPERTTSLKVTRNVQLRVENSLSMTFAEVEEAMRRARDVIPDVTFATVTGRSFFLSGIARGGSDREYAELTISLDDA